MTMHYVEVLFCGWRKMLFTIIRIREKSRVKYTVPGTPRNSIGPYDMLIAGHARASGLTLVTNNISEFERVPGLLLENWTGSA